MRWATLVLLTLLGCNDLRDFQGAWLGGPVGDAAVLHTNVDRSQDAVLTIDRADSHGLAGTLSVGTLIARTPIASLAGAEADVLAGMTFTGDPLRVYLAFAPVRDGAGDALVIVALYADHRVELRLLRGGTTPLYGIFALQFSTSVPFVAPAPGAAVRAATGRAP